MEQGITGEQIKRVYETGYREGRIDVLFDDVLFDGIERGRNEAWEAAKRILRMSSMRQEGIFGCHNLTVLENVSASEAIEKLKAYEEQKKEDSEIRIGDEVIWTEDNSEFGVVTRIESSENAMWIIKPDGTQICASICRYWKKTGHHFPEIAEVLKKMQDSE